MTDHVESDGWLIFTSGSDTIKVFFEELHWKFVKKPLIYHYEGGSNVAVPVFKTYLQVNVKGIWLDSETKITNFLKYMDSWTDSGTLTMTLQYNSSSSLQKLDGVNTSYEMIQKRDFGDVHKIADGDQEYYYIDKLMLEQGG